MQRNNAKQITTTKSVKQPIKNSQTKILMTNGGLMKVESITECSPVSVESIAGAFCNTFDLH